MAKDNDVVVITGAGRGIGAATARLAAQREELRRLEDELGSLHLLAGIEVDVHADGALDLAVRERASDVPVEEGSLSPCGSQRRDGFFLHAQVKISAAGGEFDQQLAPFRTISEAADDS